MMNQPIITLAGTGSSPPKWAELFCNTLPNNAACRFENDREHYVPRLVDSRSVLIIVNSADENWRFWTATPKSSPATRRIPVWLITENKAIHSTAHKNGVDLVLSPTELIEQGHQLITEYARLPDSTQQDALNNACQDPLPELAVDAIAQFNAGEYYAQHDLLEELWMATEEPVRDLYRAVLQVGIAYYQITRGNHRGALKMLLRSKQWLVILPDQCQGIDVKALREDSDRVRAALEQLGEDQVDQFDKTLLQPVKMAKRQSK